MDTVIKAAPMESQAVAVETSIKIVVRYIIAKAVSLFTQGVVLIAVPSLGSHSLSAVAPDNTFGKELAKAGARAHHIALAIFNGRHTITYR